MKQNHRHQGKDSPPFEDFRQVPRLIMFGVYEPDEPGLTATIEALATKVPAAFDSLRIDIAEEEEIGVVTLRVVSDPIHIKAKVFRKIETQEQRKKTRLPCSEGQMSKAFEILVRRAYTENYDKNIIIAGKRPIK